MRAAVVGTGFGARVHVPALRAAGFDVVALVGTDADRTERRAARVGVGRWATSLADVLDDVDAVTIATPPDTHALLAAEAVAAGRHVLCEKPFTLDASEAAALVTAADAAGVVALVGHEFRYAVDRAVIGRALRRGVAGEPRVALLAAHVALAADPSTAAPSWWFDAARGGGWLGASGSHVVDQVRSWLGDVEAVSADLAHVVDGRGAEDGFDIRFRTRSGCVGSLQQTCASWGPPLAVTRVVGSTGTVWSDGTTGWVADADGARPLDVDDDLALPSPPQPRDDDARHRFTHLELGPYTRLAEVWRDAIEGGPLLADPAPATFADGLATMQVLDAVRRSAAQGGAWTSVEPPPGAGPGASR